MLETINRLELIKSLRLMLNKTLSTIINQEKLMVCLMINTPNKKVKVMKLHQWHNILERVDHIWVT